MVYNKSMATRIIARTTATAKTATFAMHVIRGGKAKQ